ncbi:MAG: type IX secretion system membrane protein PorP/SprF [Bacteroidota bacterium]
MLLLVAAHVPHAHAQRLAPQVGAFADIGLGARPAALGQAYVGLADDAFAVLWNPAGLGQHSAAAVGLSYAEQWSLIEYQSAVLAVPVRTGGLGLAVLSSGDDALREVTLTSGYAHTLGALHLGLALKYRHASFGNNTYRDGDLVAFDPDEIAEGLAQQVQGTAVGFGVDVGVMLQVTPRISVGAVVQDVYAPVSWASSARSTTRQVRGAYEEHVPFRLAVGSAYKLTNRFTVAADYRPALSDERADALHVGGEVYLIDVLRLRGGVHQRVGVQPEQRYSFGMGVALPLAPTLTLGGDYAYLVQPLGSTQHLTLSLTF